MMEQSSPRQTIAAAIATIILFVPCYFLGGLAVIVYLFFHQFGASFDAGVSWIPFLSGILKLWWEVAFPEVVRGAVASYAALLGGTKFFPHADRDKVIFAASATWASLVIILILLSAIMTGPDKPLVQIAFFLAGIFAGVKLFR
jgi:hypothetical protein